MKFNPTLIKSTSIFLSTILIVFSCKDDQSNNDNNEPILRALSNDEQTIITSANDFSFELLKIVSNSYESENVFISPFSVNAALSMTLNGANGNTKDSIIYALGLEGLSEQQINQAYLDLTTFLLGLDKKVTFDIANSNWYAENLTLNSAFRQTLLDYYDAEVRAVDFRDTKTVGIINDWVEEKTNDKIKDLISELDPMIIMVLVNAVYFNAEWTVKFDKDDTQDQLFYLENGTSIMTPMMHNESTIVTAQNDQMRLIDVPYGNGQFRFTIVMSAYSTDNENYQSLNDIIGGLNSQVLNTLLENGNEMEMDLYLPKFTFEFKTELREVLEEMGMGIAFTENADFKNLFEESSEASIDEIIHQSYIDVNEKGTEAAAATAIVIKTTSLGPIANVNQPFAYLIREQHSNTILFSGKMLNPEE